MAENNTSLPSNMALDSKLQKKFSDTVQRITKDGPTTKAVVYVGHIPHGFYEEQMKQYFEQFGKVSRLRMAMSKKTGKTKGYAFVEFANSEVAKIVADTMNNYLMFHKLLKCEIMAPEKVHPAMFKNANRKFTPPAFHKVALRRRNKERTNEQVVKAAKRIAKKKKRSLKKLNEGGVQYEFKCQYVAVDAPTEKVNSGTEKDGSPAAKKQKTMATKVEVRRATNPKSALKSPNGNKEVKTPQSKKQTPVKKNNSAKKKPVQQNENAEKSPATSKSPATKKQKTATTPTTKKPNNPKSPKGAKKATPKSSPSGSKGKAGKTNSSVASPKAFSKSPKDGGKQTQGQKSPKVKSLNTPSRTPKGLKRKAQD